MANNVEINASGNIFEMLEKLRTGLGQVETQVQGLEETVDREMTSMNKSLGTINLVSITQGFQQLSDSLNSLNGPGLNFQKSMADMSAITGLTGDALAELGEMARQNALDFGGDAASSVETYKLLLSQLGPGLAKTPELLNEMARSSETLAKTMGGDVTGATQVLTTAMNQYNVDMSDPIKATETLNQMMNAMAASAKEGSSELPTLQSAVNVVGGDASRAGVHFNEMLASIQILDKAGKKGAEGGVALRNVLSSLAQGRFLPKDVQEELKAAGINVNDLGDKSKSLQDRLELLKPIANDTALVAKLFGKENQGSAQALIQAGDAMGDLTEKITGTNTAFEQAEVIMETTAEKQARMKAAIDDAKISFFEATGGASAYLAPLAELGTTLAGFAPVIGLVGKGLKLLKIDKLALAAASKVAELAQWAWNAALNANPIGLIIAGVVALTAVVYALAKAFDTSTGAERANQAIKERVIEKTAQERAELDVLFEQLKKTNKGSKERNEIVDELNKLYPDILSNYDLEKASLEDINAAQQEIIKSIDQRAEAEAAMELLTENKKKQFETKNRQASTFEKAQGLGSDVVFKANRAQELVQLQAEEKALLAEVQRTKKNLGELPGIDTGGLAKNGGAPEDLLAGQQGGDTGSLVHGPKSKKVSGEHKAKSITVTIDKLIENFYVTKAHPQETMADIKNKITDTLVGAVRDFEVAVQ